MTIQQNVPEDVYELQIVKVEYKTDIMPHPQNKNQTPADEVMLICEVIGTKNPDFEDAPYKVWIFGARDTGNFTYTDKKTGAPRVSYPGQLLMGLGFDRDTVAPLKFKELGWQALDGLFLRATVKHNPLKPNMLQVKMPDLLPVKNEEHIKRNQSRKADILKQVAV